MYYKIEVLENKSDSWRLVNECIFDTKEDAEKRIGEWQLYIVANKFRVVPCEIGDTNGSLYMQ